MSNVENNINVGYSDNIKNDAFLKKNEVGFGKNQQLIYIITVAITTIIVMVVGISTDDIKGAGLISALLLFISVVIFLALKSRQKLEMTYDGVIKAIEKQVEPYKKNRSYLRTLIVIKADDDKEFIYNGIFSSMKNDYTTYYKEGDKVRHHDGFNLPEKFDKTSDDKVVCILCGELVDKENNECNKCGKILLK